MDETLLLSALRRDIDSSTGTSYEELNYSRAKALKYYLGEPYGNEVAGRSKIVTTEVADTVEAMLPQVLKPFVSTERVVFFEPVGPEDEEAAEQQTDYLNHVFYKENDGVSVLYTWCKDGLMSKNGIVKYYWEETEDVVTESYTGLDEMELMALLADESVEVDEQTENLAVSTDPMGMPVQSVTFDVKIKRTHKDGRVRVVNVPPEEFIINSEWNELTLKNVPFCAHETETTLSDLKARGYDTKELEAYAGAARTDYDDLEEEQRFSDVSDDPFGGDTESVADPSMRKVKLHECYKRVDYDGDGYAELRRILLVNETHILENEEIDYIPFEAWTPIPMPHRFFGRSAADQTMDLQLQKSMLTRNILDNLYLINNARYAVVDGEVNMADAMDSTPGALVRQTAPGMIAPLPTQPFTGHAFGMLEYLDSIKENRTGVTRYNQGIDADSLNKTASGINRIMDASAQRVEMVARLFGEAVKRLMLGLHRLLLQNQDKQKVIRLKGNWVSVSPSEWRERENMTVQVGLGTENKDRLMTSLMTILQVQKEALQGGLPLVTPKNVYQTLIKLVEASGLKEPAMYFTPPEQIPPAPPQPNPQVEMVKMQSEIAQRESQVKDMASQRDFEIDKQKILLERERIAFEGRKVSLEERKVAVLEKRLMIDATKAKNEIDNDVLDREIDAVRAEMNVYADDDADNRGTDS